MREMFPVMRAGAFRLMRGLGAKPFPFMRRAVPTYAWTRASIHRLIHRAGWCKSVRAASVGAFPNMRAATGSAGGPWTAFSWASVPTNARVEAIVGPNSTRTPEHGIFGWIQRRTGIPCAIGCRARKARARDLPL